MSFLSVKSFNTDNATFKRGFATQSPQYCRELKTNSLWFKSKDLGNRTPGAKAQLILQVLWHG